MAEIGYALSSEEHRPNDLIHYAKRAEETGFRFALISDHYHPWIDKQGHSSFVWSVLGGIAQATERLRVGTGVTCPTIRYHPAIIAQAAATVAAMMPNRFFFGVGSGENVNEHITGERWPPVDIRQEMLVEAIDVIRSLWEGGSQSYYGRFYTVEDARLYTLPDTPPPIFVAAGGENSAELAGQAGDGLISTAPKAELVQAFAASGGQDKPCIGQLTVCWNQDEAEARRIAYEYWPTAALKGELSQELPLPEHFEQAAGIVTEDQVAQTVICGPDPERHIAGIRQFIDAGFNQVYIHQIGPDQEGFFQFYAREILPKL